MADDVQRLWIESCAALLTNQLFIPSIVGWSMSARIRSAEPLKSLRVTSSTW